MQFIKLFFLVGKKISYSQFCKLSEPEIEEIIPSESSLIQPFKVLLHSYKKSLPKITVVEELTNESSIIDVNDDDTQSNHKENQNLSNSEEEVVTVKPCDDSLDNFLNYESQYSQSKFFQYNYKFK